jgi:hypothetical protein
MILILVAIPDAKPSSQAAAVARLSHHLVDSFYLEVNDFKEWPNLVSLQKVFHLLPSLSQPSSIDLTGCPCDG